MTHAQTQQPTQPQPARLNPQNTVSLRRFASFLLVGLCLLLGACKGYYQDSPHRTAGEGTDDRAIHTAVKAKLVANGETRGWKINVGVFRSQVTLTGYVKSEEERSIALELARNTKGVKEVADKLVVLPPPKS